MSELKVINLGNIRESIEKDEPVYYEYYAKSEADKVIERIIKGAMSMFRESNRCRGLDTKSPLGRIADVAFKHWMYVERMEARITEKDKEIAELKEFIKNYQFDNINMLHKIMKQDAELRHHKHKRCLEMARFCEERYNYLTCLENWQMTDKEYQQVIGDYWDRWHKRWEELAEEPTWEKFLQLIRKETKK